MAEQYSRFLMRQIFVLLVLIDIKSWVTCHKLPQVGYFGLIAVWTSRHYILTACQPREVDLGGEVDSWHNIWTLEPGNERQLLDLILNIALDQIPLCAACPATAKSLVGVERQEVEDTGKRTFVRKGITLVQVMVFPFFTVSIVSFQRRGVEMVCGCARSNTADTGRSSGTSQWPEGLPALQVRGQAALFQMRKML